MGALSHRSLCSRWKSKARLTITFNIYLFQVNQDYKSLSTL